MPINPTWPTDGQSDWDVPLLAGLDEVVDEINAQETAIAGKAASSHTHDVDDINATGTPSSTTYLRGDGTWSTPAGGGGGATDLEGLSDVDLTSPADNQFLRFNGTEWVNEAVTQDDIDDGATYKQYSATEKTKLAGVASGATANASDADLRDRSTHTGTQTAATISDFDTAADARVNAARGLYVGINAQTGTTYAPVLSDQGKLVTLSNAGAITVTMPQDSTTAFPVGATIDFVVIGAGMATFSAGTGATVNPTSVTRAQWSAVTAIKRAANTWLIVGDIA